MWHFKKKTRLPVPNIILSLPILKINSTQQKQNNLCVCDVLENLLPNKFIQKSRKNLERTLSKSSADWRYFAWKQFPRQLFLSPLHVPFSLSHLDVAEKIWMKRISCFEHLRLKLRQGEERRGDVNLNLIQFVQPHVSWKILKGQFYLSNILRFNPSIKRPICVAAI